MIQKSSVSKVLLVLSLMLVFVLGISTIAIAGNGINVTIGNTSVAVGEECEIVLNISQAKNVGAYEFKVVYDTNNLEFVSGETLLTSSAADFYDDGANVNVSVVLKNGISSNDSCEFVKLKFKAKSSAKEGEYAVEIKNGSFADIDTYEELAYSYTKGIIYVNKLPKGDLDGNGKINVVDAMRIFHYVSGRNKELTSLQQSASDIDGNGKINIVDAMKVFHYTSGRISSLDGETTTVAVTGVTLNKTSVALNPQGTVSLTETVSPSTASNKNVTWSSSNTTVAMVNSAGKVTAVGNGTAVITVKTADGGYTATCTVTVTTKVTGIKLDISGLGFNPGHTNQLTATVSPSTASNKSVTWSSSNTSVVTVDNNGKLTAIANGTATITVKTIDGGYTAKCNVTVTTPAAGVKLNTNSLNLNVNGTSQLTATVSPSTASDKTVIWSSSNTAVAKVDANGKVTAVANGTATITVKTSNDFASASCTVTVTTKPTGVTLNTSSLSLNPNGTAALTATVTPSTASDKNVTWSSSNTSVATVNSAGKVTAVANGTATITVKTADGGKTASCTVTVTTKTTGVSITNKQNLTLDFNNNSNKTYQCTVSVSPSTASNKNVTWSSSNTAVATVSSTGLVTAVARGTATITVKTVDGSYTDSFTVYVYKTNPEIPSGGNIWYRVSIGSTTNRVMDVNGAETYNGAKVQLYSLNSSDAQLWQFHDYRSSHGGIAIVPKCNSGAFILDANRGSSYSAPLQAGCLIDTWTLGDDDAASMWELIRLWDGSYIFKLINTNLVVGVTSTDQEAQLVLKNLDMFDNNQKWFLEAVDTSSGGTSSGTTRAKAVAWAQNKIGTRTDTDGQYGAQCKDFVNAYTQELFGITFAGNANNLIYCSLPTGWTRIKNTADFIPQPGDIALWDAWDGNAYGHTGVIISANLNTFVSIDQNWNNFSLTNGSAAAQVTHNYTTYSFWGVLRPPFSE